MRSISLLVVAACAENHVCDVPAMPLPEGRYSDPYSLPLSDCIPGGLESLPGRWFINQGAVSYPRYEGSCNEGFRPSLAAEEDHDPSDDGVTRYIWSDGTRLFERFEQNRLLPVSVTATATCLVATNRIAIVSLRYFDKDDQDAIDGDTYVDHVNGVRFGAHDSLASGIELIGETAVSSGALNLVVDGNYAYIATRGGFDIVDVSNPTAPAPYAHLSIQQSDGFNDVKLARTADKLYAVLSPLSGKLTYIVDVTNPSAPRHVSSIPEYSHSIFVLGTDLYLANYGGSVPKYDITDPLAPIRVGAARIDGAQAQSAVHDLFVDGETIYVNFTSVGFVVLDVSRGIDTPIELGRTSAQYIHSSWAGIVRGHRIILHVSARWSAPVIARSRAIAELDSARRLRDAHTIS